MIPHTFLLGPGLKIHKIWNGYYYRGRPSVYELHQELRELTRSIRADWDLSNPEPKRKWDAGDKSALSLRREIHGAHALRNGRRGGSVRRRSATPLSGRLPRNPELGCLCLI